MNLTGLVPILKCRSVTNSLKFYKDTLRFVEIRTRKSAKELEWVYLKSGSTYLMLELMSETELQQNNAIQLYFYVDNIDDFYRYMSAKSYAISSINSTDYGLKQCGFQDPDGHKIIIGELIK